MRGYDSWKLRGPYDDELDVEAVARFYDVEPEDVSDDMLCDYEHDVAEAAACRFHDV